MSRNQSADPILGKGNSISFEVPARDGALLPVTVHGRAGPAVILIHGWSCSAAFWRLQADILADRFRVVTVDLPGHGKAGPARGDPWSIEGFGADVVAVADRLEANQVALVGHSMGGAVALEAALALGARCRLLLGVDTFTEAAFYAARPAEEIASRAAAFAGDFAGRMRGMITAITGEGAEPSLVAWIGDAMAATDPAAALAVLEALLAWDIAARWPALAAPAVTINSGLLARRNELLDLPGLDVLLMEGPGHFPMLESPREFNALARDILTRHLA